MVPAPWARACGGRAERRGHRRPPHPQRRARAVPLGPDHPRAVPGRRRRRLPPGHRRPVGARRPRRGAPGVPDPDRAGARVGDRRHPPRPAPLGHVAAAGVLRRLPRPGRRVPPPHPPAVDGRRARRRLPVPAPRRRRGRALPRPLRQRLAGRQPGAGHAGDRRSLQPGVTEIHVQPAIDTPEVRAISPDAEGWVDDLDLIMDPALREALDAAGAVTIGYRELRDLMRRELPRSQLGLIRGVAAVPTRPSGVGLEDLRRGARLQRGRTARRCARPPSTAPACRPRSGSRPQSALAMVTTTSASSGPTTISSFLPRTMRYWTVPELGPRRGGAGHEDTRSRTPANRSSSSVPSGGPADEGAGEDPVLERVGARPAPRRDSPNQNGSLGIDLRGVGPQRLGPRPQVAARRGSAW